MTRARSHAASWGSKAPVRASKAASPLAWLAVAGAVARRPGLWATGFRQARRLAAPGGVRPAPAYLAFRLTTQYGDPTHAPVAADVVSYLRWCRQWDAVARRPR